MEDRRRKEREGRRKEREGRRYRDKGMKYGGGNMEHGMEGRRRVRGKEWILHELTEQQNSQRQRFQNL